MIERLSKTKRNLALAVLALLLIWFSWTVRSVLNPLVLGYMLATILHPLVDRVESRGWKRRSAVNLTFVGFSLLFLGVGYGVYVQGRMLVRDVFDSNVDLIGRAEGSFDAFVAEHEHWFLRWLPDGEEGEGGAEGGAPGSSGEGTGEDTGGADGGDDEAGGEPGAQDPTGSPGADAGALPAAGAPDEDAGEASVDAPVDDEPQYFKELLRSGWAALSNEQAGAGQMALKGAGSVWALLQRWFGSVLGFATLVFMLPIYTYFLLFELERIHGFVRRYLPIRERQRLSRVGRQIGEVLANFFRGRLLICFLKGALLTLGLWIVGIPYALLLGMGSGFLALVPFIGPLIGFVCAFLIGLLPEGATFGSVLVRTGLVFAVAEIVEGYLLIPKVLGDSLGLHPVVVLVAVFVGGAALGMFGFLIAIPLMASLVIAVRELVLPALAQFADEGAGGAAAEKKGGGGRKSSKKKPKPA